MGELSIDDNFFYATETGRKFSDLLGNLRRKFQRLTIELNRSGAATDEPPKLYKSEAIYQAYKAYHEAYFPQGSSAKPKFIMEPGKMVTFKKTEFPNSSSIWMNPVRGLALGFGSKLKVKL